jgi:hypothetical protein
MSQLPFVISSNGRLCCFAGGLLTLICRLETASVSIRTARTVDAVARAPFLVSLLFDLIVNFHHVISRIITSNVSSRGFFVWIASRPPFWSASDTRNALQSSCHYEK